MKKTMIYVAVAGLALGVMLFAGTTTAAEPVEIYTSTGDTCRYSPGQGD